MGRQRETFCRPRVGAGEEAPVIELVGLILIAALVSALILIFVIAR